MKLIQPTKSFYVKCKRVWTVLKKPTKKEFQTTVKVSAIGVGILGILGFIISIIMSIFNPAN